MRKWILMWFSLVATIFSAMVLMVSSYAAEGNGSYFLPVGENLQSGFMAFWVILLIPLVVPIINLVYRRIIPKWIATIQIIFYIDWMLISLTGFLGSFTLTILIGLSLLLVGALLLLVVVVGATIQIIDSVHRRRPQKT